MTGRKCQDVVLDVVLDAVQDAVQDDPHSLTQ